MAMRLPLCAIVDAFAFAICCGTGAAALTSTLQIDLSERTAYAVPLLTTAETTGARSVAEVMRTGVAEISVQ